MSHIDKTKQELFYIADDLIGPLSSDAEMWRAWAEHQAGIAVGEFERFIGRHALFLDSIDEVQEYPMEAKP